MNTFQTTQLLGGAIGSAVPGAPITTAGTGTSNVSGFGTGTTTTTAPNNAGYGLLGSVVGAIPSFIGSTNPATGAGSGYLGLTASDERVKTDKKKVGKLKDGQNIYTFRYITDPENLRRIGLMAQEVEKKYPEAVAEIDGIKHVHYGKIAEQLGLAA